MLLTQEQVVYFAAHCLTPGLLGAAGNQLINNYRKFLLAYERHHRPRDLPAPPASEVPCLLYTVANHEISRRS